MLSVIVPARNNPTLTAVCISSAIRSVDGLHLACEFVLIDDASDPAEQMLKLFKKFRNETPRHKFVMAR